jgi:hypothetical protein
VRVDCGGIGAVEKETFSPQRRREHRDRKGEEAEEKAKKRPLQQALVLIPLPIVFLSVPSVSLW